MCDRKYMLGGKSTFGSSWNGKKKLYIMRFKYVWEPFPHLQCENGSECGIGMDCPVKTIVYISFTELIEIPKKKQLVSTLFTVNIHTILYNIP